MPDELRPLPHFPVGTPGAARDRLVAGIRTGTIRSATVPGHAFEAAGLAVPEPGDRLVVDDSDGAAAAVIEITEVARVDLDGVSLGFRRVRNIGHGGRSDDHGSAQAWPRGSY